MAFKQSREGTCSVPGCDKPILARRICGAHYQRFAKSGSFHLQEKTLRPISERFWEKVQKTEGCWLWTASCDGAGYGQLSTGQGRKIEKASRISWRLHFGEIPAGMNVLHRCDNPPCVRPDHLFLGTKKDNSQDMVAKGRSPNRKGEQHPRCKLSDEQVIDIRRRFAAGEKQCDIADYFGINFRTVNLIVLNKTWTHLKEQSHGE